MTATASPTTIRNRRATHSTNKKQGKQILVGLRAREDAEEWKEETRRWLLSTGKAFRAGCLKTF
jgi:hypothetical protein